MQNSFLKVKKRKREMSDIARPNWLLKLLPTTVGQKQTISEACYYDVLDASRRPVFYLHFAVPDTFDGRFDMLCAMMSVMMARLKQGDASDHDFSQDLFDAMFRDVDLTLREMGAGDIGVGKRVKKMSEAFMGRLSHYDKGFQSEDAALLAPVIARNVFRREDEEESDQALAEYLLGLYQRLLKVSGADIRTGKAMLSQLVAKDW